MRSLEVNQESKRLKNQLALYGSSAEDYISGRCLYLNLLILPGLILKCTAIEKILKAIIGLKDPSCNLKAFGHNLTKLFTQVNQYTDYEITRFGNYIPKLEQIYQKIYHNNSVKEFIYGGPDDDGVIDNFYIELIDKIVIAPEIKFNSGLLSIVFDPYDQIRQHKRWALLSNSALATKLSKWQVMADKYCYRGIK